jgi:hypothetical protein
LRSPTPSAQRLTLYRGAMLGRRNQIVSNESKYSIR